MTNTKIEFKRIQTGIFEIYVDGVKSDWGIQNGCLGNSGYGENFYILYNGKTDKCVNVGPLVSAKAMFKTWANKKR